MSSKNAYSPVTTLENATGKTRNVNPEGSAKGIWRNLGKIVISRKGSTIQTSNCPHCQAGVFITPAQHVIYLTVNTFFPSLNGGFYCSSSCLLPTLIVRDKMTCQATPRTEWEDSISSREPEL